MSIFKIFSSHKVISLFDANPDSTIDIKNVEKICCLGQDLPPEDRVVAWLLLLNVYPTQQSKWDKVRNDQKSIYEKLIQNLHLIDYHERTYLEDEEIIIGEEKSDKMESIRNDVTTTFINQYFREIQSQKLIQTSHPDQEEFIIHDIKAKQSQEMRRIERILYVYSSLNETVSYLQVFNKIVYIFYRVYSKAMHHFGNDELQLESLVFFSFQNLFSSTDLSNISIVSEKAFISNYKTQFSIFLMKFLPETHSILTKLKIDPIHYWLDWIFTLFTSNYPIDEVSLIWDSIFSHTNDIISFLNCISVAQVKVIQDQIKGNGFAATVNALKYFSYHNIKNLISCANEYYSQYLNQNKTLFSAVIFCKRRLSFAKSTILPLLECTNSLELIKKACLQGQYLLPEDRVISWLVLLKIYSESPEKWDRREELKSSYAKYIQDMGLVGYENRTEELDLTDREMYQIHIDVVRMSALLAYFPDPNPEYPNDILLAHNEQMRRMERILCIFCKLNKDKLEGFSSYIQGYNDLVGVIYYAYSQAMDHFDNDKLLMESFVFFSFQHLMFSSNLNEIPPTKDMFYTTVHKRFFDKLVEKLVPELKIILKANRIDSFYFLPKILISLFSLNFPLDKTVLIWDALLCHLNNFLKYACCVLASLLKLNVGKMDINDFGKTNTVLIDSTYDDIPQVIKIANKLYADCIKQSL